MRIRFSCLLLIAAAAAFTQGPAFAKSKKQEGRKAAQESLTLLTGMRTGTYFAIGNDIAKTAQKAGIKVQVKPSEGSIDNIRRINSNENASLGVVQSDILGFMGRSQNPDTIRMAAHLRMVMPLYREEVHVLARSEIHSFADLEGKKIIIGEDGSGHMLTARNLFAMMGVSPGELVNKATPDAIIDVLDRKADALIFVGGKPVRIFSNLQQLKTDDNQSYEQLLSKVHFLPMNDPRMLQEYDTAEITPRDYDFVTEPVPTLAVTAVLVAFDYSGSKAHSGRCLQLHELTKALEKRLPDLQAKGHPKWKEVKAGANLPIWKRDVCAWPSQEKRAKAAKKEKPVKQAAKTNLSKDLVDTIRQR